MGYLPYQLVSRMLNCTMFSVVASFTLEFPKIGGFGFHVSPWFSGYFAGSRFQEPMSFRGGLVPIIDMLEKTACLGSKDLKLLNVEPLV